MSKKTIRCISHGVIATSTSLRSPWEDVWISWKGKPGRKTYRASPCLVCVAELLNDLTLHAQIRAEQEEPDWYRDEDVDIHEALGMIATQGYGCRGTGASLEIITPARGITRKEAERMLRWYLRTHHGMTHVKFSWQRPTFVAASVGFGDYSLRLEGVCQD